MSSDIPQTQTAAVVSRLGGDIEIRHDFPVTQASELLPDECLVKLECTGVCHTDLHAKKGDLPFAPNLPLIGGHEGVGRIVAIGLTHNAEVRLGDRVGIKWVAYSCLTCEFCRKGFEQNCVKLLLSGYTTTGTFCQYVKSWVKHVTPIPENMDSFAAASILCAGVTACRALRVSNTRCGDWIVVTGSGGGLGHLTVQYAVTMGLRVLAIGTSEEKEKLSYELGAEKFIDYKKSKDIVKEIIDITDGRGAMATIVTAANPQAYSQAVEYLRPGGTLVALGIPAAPLDISILSFVVKNINIVGSYVGNRQDAIEAIALAERGKLKVHYKKRSFSELAQTFEDMEQGKVVGRIILEIPH